MKRTTSWIALLALTALAAYTGHARTARAGDGSLESFLARLRREREAEYARLRPRTEELVARLGLLRTPNERKKLHGDLDALGEEAAPLLLPYLDPGPNPSPEAEHQAGEVAAFLVRAANPALLEELVRMTGSASPRGRLLAVRVLGASPETERARAALDALYGSVNGALRAECVRALARLASDDPLIVSSLSDSHPEVLSAALRALRDEPRKAPRPEVLAVLRDPSRGADVLVELVAYLCTPGQSLDEDVAVDLLSFASREDLPIEARLAVLEGFPRLGVSASPRLRKELEPLVESPDAALRDGALVALTLLKDAKARRDLLRPYDEQVKDDETWALGYQRRGEILLRIGEFDAACRDFLRAIELSKESARLPGNRELWVNLARAYVKDGKLKAAADALEDFGLAAELKRILLADPDFAPLAEHPRYKRIFE